MKSRQIPLESYGVSFTSKTTTIIEEKLEELKLKGFCILESGYNSKQLKQISKSFDKLKTKYDNNFGIFNLKKIDEHNTLRLPLAQENSSIFLALAFHRPLLNLISLAIRGKFILNQQNGIINPPKQTYNQGKWHRDLPYQHYVSSRPIALNAIFCVDDFTIQNGSTFVLQGSHKSEEFPTKNFILNNSIQVTARKGCFIVLDCMLYHAGGKNKTNRQRRAVNHVYTIPLIKQQILIPNCVSSHRLSSFKKQILGFSFVEPTSVENYINSRLITK